MEIYVNHNTFQDDFFIYNAYYDTWWMVMRNTHMQRYIYESVINITRPTLERRKTLGHLRSINRNMITHFANQSDLPTSENLNREDPCTLHLSWPFSFFFLLHSRSVSLYTGFFLAICIFTLLCWCSYSQNSGSDLAHLFHSALYCCLISLHFTDLSLHLSLADSGTLWQSVYFFLALSAKSFCDCKYLSTIACASEDTFEESTSAKFLLDCSPLFYMYSVPSRLLFATCTSTLGMLDFSTHIFAYRFLICRPIISFTNFIKSLSLRVTFLLHFRHGLSIDRSHVHLSI